MLRYEIYTTAPSQVRRGSKVRNHGSPTWEWALYGVLMCLVAEEALGSDLIRVML